MSGGHFPKPKSQYEKRIEKKKVRFKVSPASKVPCAEEHKNICFQLFETTERFHWGENCIRKMASICLHAKDK